MLARIDLRRFKCFASLKLPLRPLTLLSGANASGKSSVLQALVLLHRRFASTTMVDAPDAQRRGRAARRRGGRDRPSLRARRLRDRAAGRRKGEYRWEFEGARAELSLAVRRVSVDDAAEDEPESLRHLLPPKHGNDSLPGRLRGLTYLTAERLGPRESYALEDPQVAPSSAREGEHAVSVLHSGRDAGVLKELAILDKPPNRLRQVEARMARFFPGCELELAQIPRANAVTLGLRTSRDTDFQRPIHTGFGLTQALPIVTAALSANRGDLLLLENPEVHLHPAGQAAMGEFLAEAASAGVQVLVETHSDHVLNGIRRAVQKGALPAADAALHFSGRGAGTGRAARRKCKVRHWMREAASTIGRTGFSISSTRT